MESISPGVIHLPVGIDHIGAGRNLNRAGAADCGDAVALNDNDRIRHGRAAIAVDQCAPLNDQYLLLALRLRACRKPNGDRGHRRHSKELRRQLRSGALHGSPPSGCERPIGHPDHCTV